MTDLTNTQDPGVFGPDKAPIPVTETPSDPFYYLNQMGKDFPTSYIDSLKAQLNLTFNELPTHRVLDSLQLSGLDHNSEPKISANELNQRFPEVEQPFTEPTSLPVAEEIARRARDRHELESILGRGPQGGAAGLSRWSASMVMGVFDPLNLIGGALSGGILEGAGLLGEATTLAKVVKNAAIEGTAGAVIPEAISGYAAVQEHQDYNLSDYFKNVATAGASFALLKTGVHYGWPKIKSFFRRVPDADRMSHEAAIAQLMMDRKVDISPIAEQMHAETNGSSRPSEDMMSRVPDYRFEPVRNGEDVRFRDLYHGSADSMGSFREAPKSPIEEDFGHGVYLTDNPVVANAHAARTITDANGKIFQVEVSDPQLNLIHADKPISQGPVKNVIESYLDENLNRKSGELVNGQEQALTPRERTPNPPSVFSPGTTVKEVLENIQSKIRHGMLPPDALDEINARLKSAGFDGYVYQGGEYLGTQNAPHNIVMLFDPEKTGDAGGLAVEKGQFTPESSMVKSPSPETWGQIAQQQAAPENKFDYDPNIAQEFERLVKQPPKEMEIPDIQENENVALETLRKMKEEGLLSPEEQKEFDHLSDLEEQAKEEETTIKAGLFCLGRDV